MFGYGACGRGAAASFRGAYARVSVADADVIITVTGARDVLTAAGLPLLRHGVILANAGHFPAEIDAEG